MTPKNPADALKVKLANGLITTSQYKEMLATLESASTSLGYIPMEAAGGEDGAGRRKTGLGRFFAR
jgi:hypothetical protein